MKAERRVLSGHVCPVRTHVEQTLYLVGGDPESETDWQQAAVGFVNTESVCKLIMHDTKINTLVKCSGDPGFSVASVISVVTRWVVW